MAIVVGWTLLLELLPREVAIPVDVGGMILALVGAGGVWWYGRRHRPADPQSRDAG